MTDYVSNCSGDEVKTWPKDPGPGETCSWKCTECGEVCTPTKEVDSDE